MPSRFVPVAEEREDVCDEFSGWEVGGGEGAGDVGDDVGVGDGVVRSVLGWGRRGRRRVEESAKS